MKKTILLSLALTYILGTQAQELPNRYIDEITSNVTVTENIIFSTNIPTVTTINLFGNRIANEESYGNASVTLKMDIYRPSGDQLTKRPVIIFAFGGGFVNGNRKEQSMIKLCEAFARRGFVTATIDYRLGMNINNPELSKRAVYRALQDGRSAVRFFRKNADTYGVDANNIYISGHSAGAFLAYQSVYIDKESERPISTYDYFGRPDLSGFDDIGDNKTYNDGSAVSGTANGVMGFAGALGELEYIESASDVPAVYFHSSNDDVVPFNSGEPFSSINWIPGINLPTVYGSNLMNSRANYTNAPHSFFPYTDRGHRVHAAGSNLYPDIAPNGAAFFHQNFLKPLPATIDGSQDACDGCYETYTANDQAYYYDWQITGGTFINRDPYSNSVDVQWDSSSSNRNLIVTPYSRQLARGVGASLFKVSDSCNWEQTSGLALDIGAGSGEVYVLGTNQKVFQWNGNNNWSLIDGLKAKSIDVQGGGHPWVTTRYDRIYRNLGNGWEKVNGIAKNVGANGNHIFVVGTDNKLYKYSPNGNWGSFPGRNVKRVDAAPNGDAWAVGSDDHVYQMQNNSWTAKKGNFRASDISVDDNYNVWAIELGTGVPHRYLGGNLWESFTGVLTNITLNSNGEIWGINSNTNIFRNACYASDNSDSKTSEIKSKEATNELSLKLYPNPVSDILNIDVSAFSEKVIKTTLINTLGQQLHTVTHEKTHKNQVAIDVSSFKNGIYILNIEIEGELPISKRVIIN